MRLIIGTTARLNVTCEDFNDALQNPAGITGTWEDPAGTQTSMSFTHVATGIYYTDQLFDQSGIWKARIVTTGFQIAGVAEQSFSVLKSIL